MANKEEKKEKSTLVHDTICLFLITLIAGVFLGGIYTVTKKPIDEQNEKIKQEAYAAVYKGAEFAGDKKLDQACKKFNKKLEKGKITSEAIGDLSDVVISEVLKAKVDGNDAGYVVKCSAKGYGGEVVIALGIDGEGVIKGIQIMDASNETPGLGQNSTDPKWNSQFKGAKMDQDIAVVKDGTGDIKNGTINAISGATITSSAVTRAIDGTFQLLATLK